MGHSKACYKKTALNLIGLVTTTFDASEEPYKVDSNFSTQKGIRQKYQKVMLALY